MAVLRRLAVMWCGLLLGALPCLLTSEGMQSIEQLGYPLNEKGMTYNEDEHLVRQVVLMNPSQQVQSDDVIINNWKIRWDYLRTKIRIQLWRLSDGVYGENGYFFLQEQTPDLTSSISGDVIFEDSLVAQHGDILGIFFVTQNPIPYRLAVGPCDNLDMRTMQLESQSQTPPGVGQNYKFVAPSVGHMCKQYLIEPEYTLVGYDTGEIFEIGSVPKEHPIAKEESSGVIILDPASTIPFRARTIGWKAYFKKALTKVRFVVLSPTGEGTYHQTSISQEYYVSQAGPFYARISNTKQRLVPDGSVIALNFSGENPIPYSSVIPCPNASRGMYLDYQSASGQPPYTFMHRTVDPCRNYSVQLQYENSEARYPRECLYLQANGSHVAYQASHLYHELGGIKVPSTKQCWIISAESGRVPQVFIQELHLLSDVCTNSGDNFVQIRDGDSKGDTLLRSVCPGELGVTVTGCSHRLLVYLKTTDSEQKRGLLFSYTSVPKEMTVVFSSCSMPRTTVYPNSGHVIRHMSPICLIYCLLFTLFT